LKTLREKLALSIIFVVVIPFALYGNLKTAAREAERHGTLYSTLEADYEHRLTPVREMLPKEGVVGFVTGRSLEPSETVLYFYLTQYSLAPLIVAKGKDHPFVLAYLKDSPAPGAEPGLQGLALVKDFGHGIRLYRGSAK